MKFLKRIFSNFFLGMILENALTQLTINQQNIVDYLDDMMIGLIQPLDLPEEIGQYFDDKDEQEVKAKVRLLVKTIIQLVVNALVANSANLVGLLKQKLG